MLMASPLERVRFRGDLFCWKLKAQLIPASVSREVMRRLARGPRRIYWYRRISIRRAEAAPGQSRADQPAETSHADAAFGGS
jgi:hypothetical protein